MKTSKPLTVAKYAFGPVRGPLGPSASPKKSAAPPVPSPGNPKNVYTVPMQSKTFPEPAGKPLPAGELKRKKKA